MVNFDRLLANYHNDNKDNTAIRENCTSSISMPFWLHSSDLKEGHWSG